MADEVSLDTASGKVTVTGLFNVIEIDASAKEFTTPAKLFFAVSDIRAATELRLCYVDLRSMEVLRTRKIPVACDDPLAITDVVVRIRSMPVPHPGVYAWELYCEGEILGSSRLNASVKGVKL